MSSPKKDKTVLHEWLPKKIYKEGTIDIHISYHEHEVTPMLEEKLSEHIIGMFLIKQYNFKTGLRMFGDKGEKVATKEYI